MELYTSDSSNEKRSNDYGDNVVLSNVKAWKITEEKKFFIEDDYIVVYRLLFMFINVD